MDILKSKTRNGITDWRTADGKFSGVLIDPIKLTGRAAGDDSDLGAGALLAVPKHHEHERPSINKYSPVIAQAATTEELGPLISAWADRNAKKTAWDFRDR